MRNFLTRLMATIKSKPRYRPEIKWSDKSWTHNVFRALEWAFGREIGIRKESSTWFENGKVKRTSHTLEAFLAYRENEIREWLSLYNFSFYPSLDYQIYEMALSLDTNTSGTTASSSPFTWSHTCTGSDLLLTVGVGLVIGSSATLPVASSVSYNSVSLTKAKSNQLDVTGFGAESSVWLLSNPSTGSNTVSTSVTNPFTGSGVSVSYTGASQLSVADATGGTAAHNNNSLNFTVTTIAANCWIFAVASSISNGGTTLTTGNTSRGTITFNSNALMVASDTNGAVASGANTMTFTQGTGVGTQLTGASSGASFAPRNTTNFFSFFQF